jgi:hypothetical protein
MQNGVGIEKPFLDAGFSPIAQCALPLRCNLRFIFLESSY